MPNDGDFFSLLKESGYRLGADVTGSAPAGFQPTEGTTILSVNYDRGVLIAGDRRATAGNSVIHDRADKVLVIDDHSVMAISGSPAMAYEIARILEHTFQYYRRSQLQELSLEGKLRRVSRLIRENLPMALQGIGAVIPIFAIYDLGDGPEGKGKIFFYDALGAQFECADFATTGSGSPAIRGALYYQNRWSGQPLASMGLEASVGLVLRLLETAAEYDTATGGTDRRAAIFPTIKTISREGIRDLPTEEIARIYSEQVER
ncbi:MAG: proteasome subunit alpha [Candidatus Latescibacteria bacterium]|nr:proteasome subunit alpha [Candidatus Latescibacterota bacterium]